MRELRRGIELLSSPQAQLKSMLLIEEHRSMSEFPGRSLMDQSQNNFHESFP